MMSEAQVPPLVAHGPHVRKLIGSNRSKRSERIEPLELFELKSHEACCSQYTLRQQAQDRFFDWFFGKGQVASGEI
jgi:hypothetical protein